MALLFDLLFREGRCLALTEEFSIDVSAVVCMVSLMTPVVLFANGVELILVLLLTDQFLLFDQGYLLMLKYLHKVYLI